MSSTNENPRRSVLLNGLKLVGLVLLLGWMVRSEKLNLVQVVGGLSHRYAMVIMLILLCLQPCVTAWRWNFLLKSHGISLPYQQAFGLTMTGLLFNVAIPGPIGGDLIKGYYITRIADGRKSAAATSILVDRLVGILGLFVLAVPVVAICFRDLAQSKVAHDLGLVVIVGLTLGVAALSASVLVGPRLAEWRLFPGVLRNVFRSLSDYSKQPRVIPIAVGVSVFSNLLPCLAYYVALRSVQGAEGVSAAYFFLLVPLGFVAIAIPISPAGIGVGQAAFFALFRIMSPAHATPAADAFTVYQLGVILVSLSGFYWYLSFKDAKAGASVNTNEEMAANV